MPIFEPDVAPYVPVQPEEDEAALGTPMSETTSSEQPSSLPDDLGNLDDPDEFYSICGDEGEPDDEALRDEDDPVFEDDASGEPFELNIVEVGNVGPESDPSVTEITVDSGAGESVINPLDLPGIPLQPSAGSKRGCSATEGPTSSQARQRSRTSCTTSSMKRLGAYLSMLKMECMSCAHGAATWARRRRVSHGRAASESTGIPRRLAGEERD